MALPKSKTHVVPHDPFSVSLMEIYRDTVEGPAPFNHRRVKVRVTNRDCTQTAESIDQLRHSLIHQADAVPEHITARRANEERALADPDLLVSSYTNQLPFRMESGLLSLLQ